MSREPFEPRLRVVVAEGDESEGALRAAVVSDRRLELVACVPHAAAAVARTVALAPDVLVVDDEIPGALSAAVEIRARMPAVQLVVVHGDGDAKLLEALAAGVSAYVARSAQTAELVETIVDVAAGDVVLTRGQAAVVVEELRDQTRPRRRLAQQPELTAREWQVLELMNNALSTPEIADRLVLSPVTVRSHARSIRKKLGRRAPVHH